LQPQRLLCIAEAEGPPEPHVIRKSGGGIQLEGHSTARGPKLVGHGNGELEYLLVNRPEKVVAEAHLPEVDDE
jgi:hypothetical protein